MARLRYNLLETTLGAQLNAAATSITFAVKLTAADGDIPTISGGDYLPLTIEDEIVYLTAYTSAATSGTISRGEEGTTDATHVDTTAVRNAPTTLDYSDLSITYLTQAEYDALSPPNPAVLYVIVASSPTPMFDAYLTEALTYTPWGLWPMQETSGTTIEDISGNGRDGTIAGSVTLGAGGPLDAAACSFTGGSPATAGIDINAAITLTSSYSLAVWFYQTSAGSQSYLIGSRNVINSGDNYWSVNNRSGNAFCVQNRVSPTTTFAPSSASLAPTNSTWNLLGVTKSGSTLSFYVNGALLHTGTTPTAPTGMTQMSIGMLTTSVNSSFTGRMAGMAVFTSALSAGDHLDLYEAGTT